MRLSRKHPIRKKYCNLITNLITVKNIGPKTALFCPYSESVQQPLRYKYYNLITILDTAKNIGPKTALKCPYSESVRTTVL